MIRKAVFSACLLLAIGSARSEPPVVIPADGQRSASPDVFFYPKQAQSAEQQDRDRYDCYLWARRKTGYDPSLVRPDLHRPVRVVAVPPPGRDVAAGTVTGAVIGAAVARPRDAGQGAVIGAIAGAVLGAASGDARRRQASEEEARRNAQREAEAARADAEVQDYRRALKVCLEGRGYSVE